MIRSFIISLRVAHRTPQRVSASLQSFRVPLSLPTMAKRKRSSVATSPAPVGAPGLDMSKTGHSEVPLPPKPTRRQSSRGGKASLTNPDANPDILDGVTALRASPDGHDYGASNGTTNGVKGSGNATTGASALPAVHINRGSNGAPDTNGASAQQTGKGKRKNPVAQHVKVEEEETHIEAVSAVAKNVTSRTDAELAGDPEAEEDLEGDEAEFKEALSRPPPVNSEYLPLPWKGRLGYVCISWTQFMMRTNIHALGLSQHIPP
jgi:UV DNA damage endonuclease